MPLRHFIAAACLAMTVAAPIDSALAQDGGPITVNANMARVLRLSAPAATVIVGNPGIADVTIQDPQTLILTGKNYGQTNLIVMDAAGTPVADTLIEVVQLQAGAMTVFQGMERTTVVCAPVCQPTVMLGDAPSYTSNAIASSRLIGDMAQ
jgi:Flp pilus assembly protein, secretin CpaC